jgi:hypothetical protein
MIDESPSKLAVARGGSVHTVGKTSSVLASLYCDLRLGLPRSSSQMWKDGA